MYLLSILSVPVEFLKCVNGITYVPVLKHLQVEGQMKTKLLKRQRYFTGNFKVNPYSCDLGNNI